MIPASRLAGIVHQFRRRGLRYAGIASLLLLGLGVVVGPTETWGAVCVSFATSILASILVAAIALEREEFAQILMDQGLQRLYDNRKTAFADSFWTGLLRAARTHYRVLGVANHGYLYDEQARTDTTEAVKEALTKRRINVEFLFLKPDSRIAQLREAEEGRRTIDDTLEALVFFWGIRESIDGDAKARLSLREYDTLPSCGLTWADNKMVITHYLAGRRNLGSPGLVLDSGLTRMDRFLRAIELSGTTTPPLSDVYARNYVEIASPRHSVEITTDRMAALEKLLSERPAGEAPSEADLRDEEDSTNGSA